MGRNHQKLNNRLEELRRKAGLTQQELSEKAEVSRKSINAIENGIYVPSTVLALKIAKTLKCKVEDLFKLPFNGNISLDLNNNYCFFKSFFSTLYYIVPNIYINFT